MEQGAFSAGLLRPGARSADLYLRDADISLMTKSPHACIYTSQSPKISYRVQSPKIPPRPCLSPSRSSRRPHRPRLAVARRLSSSSSCSSSPRSRKSSLHAAAPNSELLPLRCRRFVRASRRPRRPRRSAASTLGSAAPGAPGSTRWCSVMVYNTAVRVSTGSPARVLASSTRRRRRVAHRVADTTAPPIMYRSSPSPSSCIVAVPRRRRRARRRAAHPRPRRSRWRARRRRRRRRS